GLAGRPCARRGTQAAAREIRAVSKHGVGRATAHSDYDQIKDALECRMKLEPFAMERWQSTYENTVEYNLSESGVHPLAVHELVGDGALADRLLATELGYSQSNGTPGLRRAIARPCTCAGEEHVLVSNGSAEAIC